jgi:UPF0755 protein
MEMNKKPKVKFDFDEEVRIDNIVKDAKEVKEVKKAEDTMPIGGQKSSESFFVTESDTMQIEQIEIDSVKPKPVQEASPKPQQNNPQRKRKRKIDPRMQQIEEMRKKQALKKKMKRRKEQTRTFAHIFGSLILVVVIIISAALLSQFAVMAFLDFTGISNATDFTVFVEIPTDATTEEIAAILAEEELISMPGLFAFYSRITDKCGNYLSGVFQLNSTMPYSQLISTMQNRPQSTDTELIKITEGMTAREIGLLLEENGVCRAVDFMQFYQEKMDIFNFERRIVENPLRLNQMEGYLFPETHEFFVINGFCMETNPDIDTTVYARRAARTIFSHMNMQFTPEKYRRIGDLMKGINPDYGLDEFITLASMVQWEAADYEDMRRVASVFLNRLRNSAEYPRLQSDVTKKYANESIRPYRTSANADLFDAKMLAYDTYETSGLPPGPVCNPGMDAMTAVLEAVTGRGYLFFCSNIETGEMFFATNLNAHIQNEIKAGLRDSSGNLIYR